MEVLFYEHTEVEIHGQRMVQSSNFIYGIVCVTSLLTKMQKKKLTATKITSKKLDAEITTKQHNESITTMCASFVYCD